MALKDWEKNRAISNPYSWRKKKGIGTLTINQYMDGDWEVLVYFTGASPLKVKTFKTKYEALKYAKAYMRKH